MKSRIKELTELVVEHSRNRDTEKCAKLDAFSQTIRDTSAAFREAKVSEFHYTWEESDWVGSNPQGVEITLSFTLVWDTRHQGIYLLSDGDEYSALLGRKVADRLSAMEHFEDFLESFLRH